MLAAASDHSTNCVAISLVLASLNIISFVDVYWWLALSRAGNHVCLCQLEAIATWRLSMMASINSATLCLIDKSLDHEDFGAIRVAY